MRKFSTKDLTLAAVVAAAYAALTMTLPAFGSVQLRISEALTVLPFLFPAAAPGIAVGCFVANLLSPYGLVDMLCGTAASALAAYLTAKMPNRWLAPLPPVLCNGIIVGGMLAWYEVGFGAVFFPVFAVMGAGVALGELIACCLFGELLLSALSKVTCFKPLMANTTR